MKIIIITKIKFKKDKEKIQNILITYGFKKIVDSTQIGELNTEEIELFKKELINSCRYKDSIIIIPICQGCYNNIKQFGQEINLYEEQYVIL